MPARLVNMMMCVCVYVDVWMDGWMGWVDGLMHMLMCLRAFSYVLMRICLCMGGYTYFCVYTCSLYF